LVPTRKDTYSGKRTYADAIYEKIRTQFPIRHQATQITLGISADPETIRQQFGTAPLRQFWSEDERSLVQVGAHLLAVNHLKPYPSWSKFLPLIKEEFRAYRDAASPRLLHRVGLQYINRIEIVGQHINLEDYFEVRPFVGQDFPQAMSAFTVGIQVPFEGFRDILNVQLTSLTGLALSDMAVFILDLNYSLAKPGEVHLDDVFEWVEGAHTHIEKIFEACITARLRELFEEVAI
jgi:uncharacterized protein (TIGR04255 family)